MKDLITGWLQDQIEDSIYEFSDDFDFEKAVTYLFNEFNSEVIYDHLDSLLLDYLH